MPSENGWEPSRLPAGSDQLVWIDVPGAPVSLQVMRGRPQAILAAVAADFHAFIEPLRDPDSASYTPTNSVATSNHLNGTAMDLNWNTHPFHVRGTFNANQMATLRQLLDFYEGWIFWAGDWDDPIDEMHWQLGYNTFTLSDSRFQEFATRKLRADGFSTFRRGPIGGTGGPVIVDPVVNVPPAQTADDAVTVLYEAVPVIDEARAAELLGPLRAGLAAAQCTNPKRIAEFLAQTGWESDGYETTEEYASGEAYEGRTDLGNTQQGDGVRFKGRTYIQITGRGHYAAFGKWAASQGLVADPDYFVNNPAALGELKWAGIGAAWYWTVARPQINSLCDAGDLVGVTRAINGGTNGLEEDPPRVVNGRRVRYNQAIALGDRLLLLINSAPATDQGDDFMSELSPTEQRELYNNAKWLREQFDATDFGPDSSMGTAVKDGKVVQLTVRDGLAEEKRDVAQILELLSKPGVAIVVLQSPPAAAK